MTAANAKPGDRGVKAASIPLPKEHGAWVMLYVPIVIGLASSPHPRVDRSLLLLLAATFAFLAQDAARLLIRRRGSDTTGRWLAGWAIGALLAGAPLLIAALKPVAVLVAVAAVIFGLQSLLLRLPARKRRDRTLWGELLAVPALTLGGPAATIVSGGRATEAAVVYGLSTAYFASGIFAVKMLLASARGGGRVLTRADRLAVGTPALVYHALLTIGILAAASRMPGSDAALLAAAFVPAIVRTLLLWRSLDGRLPSLTRVGMREAVMAAWFAGCVVWVLRIRFGY